MDDKVLFKAWGEGDKRAAEQLIGRHYDAVVRFFLTKAGPEADDLVQQTFLRFGEASKRYQGTSTVRSFLFGIARNVLHEHIRRQVRGRQAEPDFRESALHDLNPGVATQARQRSDQRALIRALQLIPLESQILMELYYWEGLRVGELADLFEVPEGTIKSRLSRARHQLKGALPKVPTSREEAESVRVLVAEWLSDMREQAPAE